MEASIPFDLVIANGRVVDPETRLDATRNVGMNGGSIEVISEAPLDAPTIIDAAGCIVAPGFIDLHSHAQTVAGHRLQAFDGVTTALELESGASPVGMALARAAEEGRPLNYGFSASWGLCRMHVLIDVPLSGNVGAAIAHFGDPRWQGPASAEQVDRMLGLISEDLSAGALGVGILVGYAQGTDPAEYSAVARLAASAKAPTFTHARDLVEVRPDVPIDGAAEIVGAASETGAHMHYCHVNSTSTVHIDRVHGLIDRVRNEGATVSFEAYPYGAGMTVIGAQFLAPDMLAMRGLEPSDLVLPLTGERIADAERLAWIRENEPHHTVIVEFMDDQDGLAPGGILRRALSLPGTVVASDAIFPIDTATNAFDSDAWPLPKTMRTHPRTCGTFSRSLRLLVDDVGMSWVDAVERCTLEPARVLESIAPAMERKGRLQPGCDADVVVFDPKRLRDQATYQESIVPSDGVEHLLVNGVPVIRDGELLTDARPGRAVVAG
ncbi:MAG: amidohydrolase family protein [Actinomycetota bacterium]